jgi:PBP1b-binding outer membrane lipoprotein LpoB
MKKAYLLLVLTSLLFGSCKKQEENKKEEEEKPQVELPKNMQKKSSENLSESTIEDAVSYTHLRAHET